MMATSEILDETSLDTTSFVNGTSSYVSLTGTTTDSSSTITINPGTYQYYVQHVPTAGSISGSGTQYTTNSPYTAVTPNGQVITVTPNGQWVTIPGVNMPMNPIPVDLKNGYGLEQNKVIKLLIERVERLEQTIRTKNNEELKELKDILEKL